MNGDSQQLKTGILLDIGCGKSRRPGFTGMDKRADFKPDIVHDIEVFPYPLSDESCLTIVAAHIIEHIKPWLFIEVMNELWRVIKPEGQLAIVVPYGYSDRFLQDPTHCNACNHDTWKYFDPRFPLYGFYEPKPWRIQDGFPQWIAHGDMEVILQKLPLPTTNESC